MFTKNANAIFGCLFFNSALNSRCTDFYDITTVRGAKLNDDVFTSVYTGNKSNGYYNRINNRIPFVLLQTQMATGDISNLEMELNASSDPYTRTTGNVYGFIFGDGNVPPTLEDYMLSGNFVKPATYDYTVVTEIIEGDGYLDYQFLYTITNVSDEPITIGEIGVFSDAGVFKEGSSFEYKVAYLVERTAFATPITIEQNGVGQITYTVRFNYSIE